MKGIQLIVQGLKELSMEITSHQKKQFSDYYEMLIERNKVMNLTAITNYDEVMIKHFLDSLLLVKSININDVGKMIDVGTGAGFPGIPIKIMFPHLKLTLLDSLNKRIKFLEEVITQLGLENVDAVHGRAEDLGKNIQYREKYDLCVSRAVANLSSLSEYCLPFVKVKGNFISYKSLYCEEEVKSAKNAINTLGGKIEKMLNVALPFSDIQRVLVIIEKEKDTPKKYPRKAGFPTREPIN